MRYINKLVILQPVLGVTIMATSKSKGSKKKVEKTVEEINQETWCAALSYLFIGLVWFAVDDTMKKNNFVKFHVKQALVIIIFGALLSIVTAILVPFSLIPVVGIIFGIFMALIGLAQILLVIFAIIGIVYSFMDKQVELPLVGPFARKLRF